MAVLKNISQLSLLSMLSVGVLACSSIMETPNQTIEIVTPGAVNARCEVQIGNLRYPVEPPQKLTVRKTHNPITVDCIAPGGRHQFITFDPKVSKYTAGNVLSAGVGAGYDYVSGAMFKYPELISVNFDGVLGQNPSLPAIYAPDVHVVDPRHNPEYLGAETLESRTSWNRNAQSGWIDERERRKGSVDTGYKAKAGSRSDVINETRSVSSDVPELVSPYFPTPNFEGSTSF